MDFPIELPDKSFIKAQKLGVSPADIEESFVRGSGSGGQKINKTSNCVWLKHGQTGTEVKVQRHRERERNRISAYKLLIEKIEEKLLGEQSERAKRRFKLRKQKARRTRRSKEKMLEQKRRRSEARARRKPVDFERHLS